MASKRFGLNTIRVLCLAAIAALCLAGVVTVLLPQVVHRFWPATPRLSNVTCTPTHNGSVRVSGEITNPAWDSRTFAIRPTVWLRRLGEVAKDMHDYVSVPGHATKQWSVEYTVGNGTPGVTRCAPYAYQADPSPGD